MRKIYFFSKMILLMQVIFGLHLPGFKINEQVDVAAGMIPTIQSRAEKRQTADMVTSVDFRQ